MQPTYTTTTASASDSPFVLPQLTVERPSARGKFIFVGDEKLYLRGVTYGTFRPDENGLNYPARDIVEQDLASMAANGINSVRTYTVPPRWFLDLARSHGIYVMVGIPWEQHIAFLDSRERARSIERQVRAGVRACAGHPAVLAYAVGNEIPASIVRWYGAKRIERFLRRLYRAAKAEDPGGLVTYVNYPSTEYLDLPFLDFVSFNVYLESWDRLRAYLARLQNIAADRPLVLAEVGLDSYRHGLEAQARALNWQVRTAFAGGCAGAFIFAWTDEWHRGGHEVEDWDFGLTTRDRQPKPALAIVRQAFADVPLPTKGVNWPSVSVIVCSYNGARTIGECLQGLAQLDYPNYEVIVVDDGSTDDTAAIAGRFDARLIRTDNRGLSAARNIGLWAARGEIVAYIDDDAYPDPEWLTYLAATFMNTTHAGVGGPNIPPPGDGPIAECVANAPGGPIHVLLSDEEAEHIPGCNMAFRKAALRAIGGFDPQFRVAGDDVDVCWRIRERGWTLGYSPAALVWHHRRNAISTYWRQQRGYGRAEALLEKKWPEKYNAAGHIAWSGRLYARGLIQPLNWSRGRIYQGVWGSALFQSIYQPAPGTFSSLPMMPEWLLVIAALGALSIFGAIWGHSVLVTVPVILIILAVGASILQSAISASRAVFTSAPASRITLLKMQALTALLYLVQPVARLWGRVVYGLSPWRRRGNRARTIPLPRKVSIWSERWKSSEQRLEELEKAVKKHNLGVLRSGGYDSWDLEVRSGTLGSVRLRMAIEEHGHGHQLTRFRAWPRFSRAGLALVGLFAAISLLAAFEAALVASVMMGLISVLLALRMLHERAVCMSAVMSVLGSLSSESERENAGNASAVAAPAYATSPKRYLAKQSNNLHTAEGSISGTLFSLGRDAAPEMPKE